jgi:large subunit ribosomal protein LP0
MPDKSQERKQVYFEKLLGLLGKYSKILLVNADNVGSSHMQQIRRSLRNSGEILMGKNTMIRKVIKGQLSKNQELEALLPYIRGNIGFIFTNGDLNDARALVNSNRVAAPARVGSISPCDVIIPKGPTGLDPQQTSFMQALNIATKINRAQVEIINDVLLLKRGDKVGSSEATLLQKLSIKPFSYGLTVENVYDSGFVYSPAVLDLTDADLLKAFVAGIQNIAALSLQINYPSVAAIPHYFANAYKNILAISVEGEYTFEGSAKIKELLSNPEAFAAAQAAASASTKTTTSSTTTSVPAPVEEKEEEKEEEGDDDIGGLFGDF